MNTYTQETFQKYESKRPSKHSLDTSSDEHSERHNELRRRKMNGTDFEGFFYDVEDNGFGHYQTYQVDEQGEFPVCSSCHAMVMTNRGQGSACDTCQHESYMHCQADYED